MLSRPSTTVVFDRLAKATLIAAVATLLVGGGVTALRLATNDTCSVSTDGLDPHGRLFVARRVLACQDYEHGRISNDEYRRTIAAIDIEYARPISKPGVRVMWASSVLGYSTQYSETSWSAQQALGAPNVYPQHGDIAQAWASKTADDHDEWIELAYETPRSVSPVEIYETFNPGAINTVELITTSGRRIELRAPSLKETDKMIAANKSTIQTPCTSEPIAAVRINISSTNVSGWNEIDAVGLVPCEVARPVNRQ